MRPKTLIALQNDADPGEGPGVHRWMVSYADFVSLLFVLFVVLYAKLPKHPEAATTAAPQQAQSAAPVAPQPEPTPPARPLPPDHPPTLFGVLSESLRELVATGDITLVQRDEGVLLEIKDTALFASGSAEPAEQARDVFAKLSAVLATGQNGIVVEGHTDSLPIRTSRYPSNWELSTARAAAVVRALQEHGIQAGRLTAAGLAETKPRSTNETPVGRSENRRVSLLLLHAAAEPAE